LIIFLFIINIKRLVMSLLISVLFPLLVSIYVLSIHKGDYSLSPYISGIIAGICVLPIAIFFKFDAYTSPDFFTYSFSYFSFYFFVPSIFGLLLYFLLNIKSFDVRTTPCALSGIWTVFLFFSAYDFSRTPEVIIYVIFLISYIASILFYDVLVMLFQALPSLLNFLLSYSFTLLFAYLSTFSFVAWLYKNSPFIYLGLPSVFIFLFLSLAMILSYKKNSKKGRVNLTKRRPVEELFEV